MNRQAEHPMRGLTLKRVKVSNTLKRYIFNVLAHATLYPRMVRLTSPMKKDRYNCRHQNSPSLLLQHCRGQIRLLKIQTSHLYSNIIFKKEQRARVQTLVLGSPTFTRYVGFDFKERRWLTGTWGFWFWLYTTKSPRQGCSMQVQR